MARRNNLVQHNQRAVTGTWLRRHDRWHSASMQSGPTSRRLTQLG